MFVGFHKHTGSIPIMYKDTVSLYFPRLPVSTVHNKHFLQEYYPWLFTSYECEILIELTLTITF